ncbi:integrase_H2C2 domain-containing protein [Trichonephila clavipes]|nr:integrase_H2C2 domain-containing protein [Trichonephila clavipes]
MPLKCKGSSLFRFLSKCARNDLSRVRAKGGRNPDVKYLSSALLYALKVEAGPKLRKCKLQKLNIRTGGDVASRAVSVVNQGILEVTDPRNNKEDRSTKCWGCGGAGHIRNNCLRVNQKDPHRSNVIESKKVCSHQKGLAHENSEASSRRPCKYSWRVEKKFGVIDPVVRQVTAPSTSVLDPWSDESVRKDQLADPEIKPITEFKESSDKKPSWQDIASFHLTTKRYWALWDSLHLTNGVLYRKWESDDGKTFRWQLILPKTRISTVLK